MGVGMFSTMTNRTNRDIDASLVIRDRSNIYQKLKNDILKRNKDTFTPGTGGGACLSSPNRDTMIQEAAPFRGQ